MHYEDAEHSIFDGMDTDDEEAGDSDDSDDSEEGRRKARIRGIAYKKGAPLVGSSGSRAARSALCSRLLIGSPFSIAPCLIG